MLIEGSHTIKSFMLTCYHYITSHKATVYFTSASWTHFCWWTKHCLWTVQWVACSHWDAWACSISSSRNSFQLIKFNEFTWIKFNWYTKRVIKGLKWNWRANWTYYDIYHNKYRVYVTYSYKVTEHKCFKIPGSLKLI